MLVLRVVDEVEARDGLKLGSGHGIASQGCEAADRLETHVPRAARSGHLDGVHGVRERISHLVKLLASHGREALLEELLRTPAVRVAPESCHAEIHTSDELTLVVQPLCLTQRDLGSRGAAR